MSRFAPSVDDERQALLLNRLGRAAGAGTISADENRLVHARNAEGWRTFSPTVRSVLFVLVAICIAAFAWLADELHLPYGVVTLVCALAAAEYLIQRRRLFRAGIDEALWLGGCFALIISLPGPTRPEGLLLFALATLVSGIRLRQPLFITASVVLICSYMVTKSADRWIVEILALAIAFVALALLTWQWRNPCVEATLIALVVVMPLFSYILDRIEGSDFRSAIIIVVAAITAAGMIVTGLSIRHHAPLAAGLIAIAIVLLEWGERSVWLLEWRLLAAGGILLMVGVIVVRLLRSSPYGFTSRNLALFEEIDLAQLAAASVMTAHATPERQTPPAARPLEEGSFGGGGASGEY